MGLNLAQIYWDPPSSSSSTTKIYFIENFGKFNFCEVPCCYRNSVLHGHTYSILKRICNKIIKNYNRQQCLETYTVFNGGNSTDPRRSEKYYREDGRELSSFCKQRGREYKNDPSLKDERIDLKVIATNRHKNKSHTGDRGDLHENKYSFKNFIAKNNKEKSSEKLRRDISNNYNEKRGSGKLKRGKIRTEDDKVIFKLEKGGDKGWQSRISRSKKYTAINDQLSDRLNMRDEAKDGKTTDDLRKSEKAKGRILKNRTYINNLRNSKATEEMDGKLENRNDRNSRDKDRKLKDKNNVGPSEATGDKQRNEKNINENKNAGYYKKTLGGSKEKKRNEKKVEEISETLNENERYEKTINNKKVVGSFSTPFNTKEPNKNNLNDKKNAAPSRATKSVESSENIHSKKTRKQGKPRGQSKNKGENKSETNEMFGEKELKADNKGKDGQGGPLDDQIGQLFHDMNNSKFEREIGLNLNGIKKTKGDGKGQWENEKGEENNIYKKIGKEKRRNDVSHLIRLSGRKGRHEKASALSFTKKRHESQSPFRRRNGVKGSKFIQYGKWSICFQKSTRGDEVRTCDILRVYMEQRDLTRCFPCRQRPCNVCETCVRYSPSCC